MKLLIIHPTLEGRKRLLQMVANTDTITYVDDEPIENPSRILCESACNRGFILNGLASLDAWTVLACSSVNCVGETVTEKVFHVLHGGLSNREKGYLETRMKSHAKIYEIK